MSRKSHRNRRRAFLRALALGFSAVVAALGASGAATAGEIPYLSHGNGITAEQREGFVRQAFDREAREAADLRRQAQLSAPDYSTDPLSQPGAPRTAGVVTLNPEWPLESSSGVTPTDLARAYVPASDFVGVSQPDGYQQPVRQTEVATVSASGSGFDMGDASLGFILGAVLAAAGALALISVRGGVRTAQS